MYTPNRRKFVSENTQEYYIRGRSQSNRRKRTVLAQYS
jgi:hypothetical protein